MSRGKKGESAHGIPVFHSFHRHIVFSSLKMLLLLSAPIFRLIAHSFLYLQSPSLFSPSFYLADEVFCFVRVCVCVCASQWGEGKVKERKTV